MKTDETKLSRRGRAKLDPEDKRDRTVSARLNRAKLKHLDSLRAPVAMQSGEYLRCAALHRLPPPVPEINQEAWNELARACANLNPARVSIETSKQLERMGHRCSHFAREEAFLTAWGSWAPFLSTLYSSCAF